MRPTGNIIALFENTGGWNACCGACDSPLAADRAERAEADAAAAAHQNDLHTAAPLPVLVYEMGRPARTLALQAARHGWTASMVRHDDAVRMELRGSRTALGDVRVVVCWQPDATGRQHTTYVNAVCDMRGRPGLPASDLDAHEFIAEHPAL